MEPSSITPDQLNALRFLPFMGEAAAVFGTTLLLKRWMRPPANFGGRYARSLLACLAATPVALVAVFLAGLVASLVAQSVGQYEQFSGGELAKFMFGTLGRCLVVWPFVMAWLVVKPPQSLSAGAVPPPLPRAAPHVASPAKPVTANKAPFFRSWKNVFGQPEVEGVSALTDQRINDIYTEVRDAFREIANRKGESIADSTLNGLVRDLLMAEANGNYAAEFAQATGTYKEQPLQMLFWKGRTY